MKALRSPQAIAGVAARLGSIVIGFLIVHWYARFLAPNELGFFYFLATASFVINAVILIPIDLAQQPMALETWLAKRTAYPVLCLQGKISAVFIAVAIIGEILLGIFSSGNSGIIILLTFMALGSYSMASWRTFFNNIKWNKCVIANYVIDPTLRYLSLIVLLRLNWITPRSVIFGASISYFLICLSCIGFLYFKKGFKKFYSPDFGIRNLFRRAAALSLFGGGNLIQVQGYRLILAPLGFSEIVGKFALVSQLGMTATGSATSIYGMLKQPSVYRNPEYHTKSFFYGGLVLIGMLSLGAVTVGPLLLHLITDGKYTMLFPLLVVGILVDGGNMLVGALGIGPTKRGATRELIASTALGITGFLLTISAIILFHCINVWTIGIPLLIAQGLTVSCLYLMEKIYWTNYIAQPE